MKRHTPHAAQRTSRHALSAGWGCAAALMLAACAGEPPKPVAAAPQLAFAQPAGGALALQPGSSLVLVFDQPIDPSSTAGIRLRAGTEAVALDVRTVGNAVQLIARSAGQGAIELQADGLRGREHGVSAAPLRLSYRAAPAGVALASTDRPAASAATLPLMRPLPGDAPAAAPRSAPAPRGLSTPQTPPAADERPAPLQPAL